MKKFIAFLALALCMTVSASAEVGETEAAARINYKDGVMIVSGSVYRGDAAVTLNILAPDKTPADLSGADDGQGIILYCGSVRSDESGSFTFRIKLPDNTESGICNIYIGTDGAEKTVNKELYLLNSEEYGRLIADINSAAALGYEEFSDALDRNAAKLLFESKYETLLSDKEQAYRILYNYAKETGFDRDDSLGNTELYSKAIIAQAASDGKLTYRDGWTDSIDLLDADVIENYKKYINDTSEKYFTSFLKDKAESFEEFKGAAKDAVIFTAVKYPNGVNNVKKIMEQYADYLSITVSDAVLDDYSKISGGEFSTAAELASRFNSIKRERQKSSSGGSGGSGGGSGSGTAIGGITANAESVITAGKPQEIDMKFVDLNPVPWAYKAISTLYSKNIISGRTETEFYPEAPVSREEFAKLLVCLLGLENEPYKTVFADAPEGEWYTSYVNIAYSNGICSGTGDGIFGAGESITREDMSVMVYNALVSQGISCPGGELTFADGDEFSEYSKAAVGTLYAMNIINGVGENRFSPKDHATRAEAAVIIYNVLNCIDGL
ncbi:MAG: S-layer homology domain-containing protein [Monoglobaceae bacterium]